MLGAIPKSSACSIRNNIGINRSNTQIRRRSIKGSRIDIENNAQSKPGIDLDMPAESKLRRYRRHLWRRLGGPTRQHHLDRTLRRMARR